MCSLARSRPEAEEGAASRRIARDYEMARVDDAVQALRMVARLPTPRPRRWAISIQPTLARRVRELLARAALRPDLRPLLVRGAVRRARARRAEDPRLRRHGFAEVARVRPLQAVSAVAGLRLEGPRSWSATKGGWRAASTCARRRRARNGRRSRSYGTGVRDRLVSERRGREYFAPARRAATTPTRSASSGAWTTTRTRNACRASARDVLPLLRRAGPALKLLIVGADPSPAMRGLGELPGVTVTGSVPDVRPIVRGRR